MVNNQQMKDTLGNEGAGLKEVNITDEIAKVLKALIYHRVFKKKREN